MRSDPPTDGKYVTSEFNFFKNHIFFFAPNLYLIYVKISFSRTLVEACNEGDFSKVRKLLDEGRVSVHDTTEEGESLLSLACSAGYYELAQVPKLFFTFK